MRVYLALLCYTMVVCSTYTTSALKDEISNLPGAPAVPFRMFSGYIPVSPTRKLFYWFAESQSSTNANDPLLLWTNGGPGCSGLSGFLTENGPFRPLKGGSGLRLNEYSWNRIANTIFIEQPAGVGFSTIEDPSYEYTDQGAAADNLAFVRGWLSKYPQYKNNPFYITSESYGGHYMPTLAMEMLVNGTDITNFRGLAVGNPLTWMPYRNYGQFGTWAYHQLIPQPLWNKYLATNCTPPTVNAVSTHKRTESCTYLENEMSVIVQGMDPYALDYPTCLSEKAAGRKERYFFTQTVQRANNATGTQDKDYFPKYIPCEDNWSNIYLNRDDVITAIHAIKPSGGWQECNGPINQGWNKDDVNAPMMENYQKLVKSGKKYNLLIYSGDDDSVCATLGTQQFIWDLGLPVVNEWAQWKDTEGQIAGFHVEFQGLHFATIHGAGHMCPATRPAQTFLMLQKFLNNTW